MPGGQLQTLIEELDYIRNRYGYLGLVAWIRCLEPMAAQMLADYARELRALVEVGTDANSSVRTNNTSMEFVRQVEALTSPPAPAPANKGKRTAGSGGNK